MESIVIMHDILGMKERANVSAYEDHHTILISALISLFY